MADIDDVRSQFNKELRQILDLDKLSLLETSYLGRNGKINYLLSQMKSKTPEERKKYGQQINEFKQSLVLQFSEIKSRLANKKKVWMIQT